MLYNYSNIPYSHLFPYSKVLNTRFVYFAPAHRNRELNSADAEFVADAVLLNPLQQRPRLPVAFNTQREPPRQLFLNSLPHILPTLVRSSSISDSTMAPIGPSDVEGLQELVHKLEARVKQLEDKLTHAGGGPKPAADSSVRMILMGPPGAGMQPQGFCFNGSG